MNSRSLRRLAADHGALHGQPLPPNYFFPFDAPDNDDLTELDVLLAGPTHTPYEKGLFKLHLTIPPTYPAQPPRANFRTQIFHPNVDPSTGGVCVETLKRDWDAKLTLRDILVVVSCLLIQPNPDSALNADAGALLQDDYAAFTRRAEMMTSINAAIPSHMLETVWEAQRRGQVVEEEKTVDEKVEVHDFAAGEPSTAAPTRRRRLGATARQRSTVTARLGDGSPSGAPVRRRRQQTPPDQPFVFQSRNDDIFGDDALRKLSFRDSKGSEDEIFTDADQENDGMRSPQKARTPKVATPRRPHGTPVPLGELEMDEPSSDSDMDTELEEYPPSPRKSPSKSPRKQQHRNPQDIFNGPESSRDAVRREARNITPQNIFNRPLAPNSPFAPSVDMSPSPRKLRQQRPLSPEKAPRMALFSKSTFSTPATKSSGGVLKPRSPSSSEKKQQEKQRLTEMDAKLWKLCGEDVERWNRGDFDGEPFKKKASRW